MLAADSIATACGGIDGEVIKIGRVNSILYGAAGRCCIAEKFKDWVRGGLVGESPLKDETDPQSNGLIIMPDGLILCWTDQGPARFRAKSYALGSGYQYAMGAMEMGATAEEAVLVASLYDVGTGGKIISVSHS